MCSELIRSRAAARPQLPNRNQRVARVTTGAAGPRAWARPATEPLPGERLVTPSSSRNPSMAISAAPTRPDRSGASLTVISSDRAASGSERPVDRLADAGQQRHAGLRHPAGHHDPVRVEEVDQRGEHGADRPARVADELEGGAVALRGELDDLAGRASTGSPRRRRVAEQRAAPGDRLQAVLVAAAADHRAPVGLGDVDVPDVARRCPAHRGRPGRRR